MPETQEEQKEEIISQLEPKKFKLEAGVFTNNFFRNHPQLAGVSEIQPNVIAYHLNRPQAILGFAGFAQSHLNTYLREHMPELASDTPHAAITVDWSPLTDVPELRWRFLADFISQHYPDGVNLFGTSFGGFEILRGLGILNKLRSEGFTPPINTIAIVVAPTSRETIKQGGPAKLGIQLAELEGLIGVVSGNIIPHLMSKQTQEFPTPMGRTSLTDLRAVAVKLRSLARSKPPRPGDFLEGTTVHYFGTDPEGTLDPLVNQPRAIKELIGSGVNVEAHWYKPDLKFAHIPTVDESRRMLKDVSALFARGPRP